jgi:phosphatidylserine/phosphatidylglycerophosphate/cardiolipin synthase-like enzyme
VCIAACSTQSVKVTQRDVILPRVVAGTDSTCPESDVQRCSISSPLHGLADKVFSDIEAGGKEQYATILNIGEKSLAVRIHLIRSARESIEVQTFVWGSDEIGGLFASELLAAAKRGVKVRIIGDQMYSGNNPKNLAAVAQAHENFQVRLYNPFNQKATVSTADLVKGFFMDFGKLNHRMHNKLMVFDGKVAITGGRNIGNEYFDWNSEYNFLDRDVLLVGSIANDMQGSFNRYWDDPITVDIDQLADVRKHLFKDGKQQLISLPDFGNMSVFDIIMARALNNIYIEKEFIDTAHKVTDVVFTADRPQKPFVEDIEIDENTTKGLVEALKSANHSILMQTPYFIISDPAYKFLKNIRENNPDIQYTLSTNSLVSADHYYVYALSFKRKKRNVKNLGFRIHELKPRPASIADVIPRYSELEKMQAPPSEEELYEYDPEEEMEFDRFETVPIDSKGPRIGIHAKSLVIDNEIAIMGSHNFDPRGSAINTEVTLTIRDEAFAKELADDIRFSLQPENSWTIAKKQKVPLLGHISGFFGSISHMLPVFDIWPFRYTTSFELRQGMTPVSIDDPDFYKHYEDVGQFPGTSLLDNQLKTILVSGFGAVAEPLM